MRTQAKTRTKQMACRDCGTLLTVGSNTRNAPRCVECGVKACQENARQIQAKSGPAYDKWRDNMSNWALRVGRG